VSVCSNSVTSGPLPFSTHASSYGEGVNVSVVRVSSQPGEKSYLLVRIGI